MKHSSAGLLYSKVNVAQLQLIGSTSILRQQNIKTDDISNIYSSNVSSIFMKR